jgi:hypothetical protein
MKKAGWDAMRHYEILGNYCMPYFIGLEDCPVDTLNNMPKQLLLDAKQLTENFDEGIFFNILDQVYDHTQKHLTTKALAEYLISKI